MLTTSWLIKFSNDELTEVACPKTETLNHLCKSLENIKLIDKKELRMALFYLRQTMKMGVEHYLNMKKYEEMQLEKEQEEIQ